MPRGRYASAEALDMAINLYLDGLPVEEVRRVAMVGQNRLYDALRERGIPMRGNAVSHPRNQGERKRGKKKDRKGRRSVNIVQLQHAIGDDFIRQANAILNGQMEFEI